MTVRDLITKLAAYPPGAKVGLSDSMTELNLVVYTNRGDISQTGLFVDTEPTDDDAYRRGALEQLFDEVSTGIAPCGATHAEIHEASGKCEHGVSGDDVCSECELNHDAAEHKALVTVTSGDKWSKFGDKMTLEDKVRKAIETHLDLLIVEVAAFITSALLEDWPDRDAIRDKASRLYWGRLQDEVENLPPDSVSTEVREYSAWDIFIGLVFERADKAVKTIRGY